MILVHLYNKTQMEPQDEGLLEDPFAIKVSGSPLVTSRATKMLAKGSPQSILNCCTTVSCLRLKTWCVFILVPSNCVFKKNHLFEAASRMKLVAFFVKLPMISDDFPRSQGRPAQTQGAARWSPSDPCPRRQSEDCLPASCSKSNYKPTAVLSWRELGINSSK